MSLAACLARAVDAGRISERIAARINGRVQELLGKGLSEGEAMAKAARELAAEAAERERQTALRVLAAARNADLVRSHPDGTGAGVLALLARDLRGKATYTNVEQRARAVRGLAHAGLVDVLDRFRTTMLGLMRDERGLTGFVRALYGEAEDEALTALARAWNDTADGLLDRFIAAGGNPATRRQDWRLPQAWDASKVRAAGREQFLRWLEDEHAAGRLRVRDFDTGQEVDALRRAQIFNEAFDRISTEGLSDLVPGAAQGRGALANRRTKTRAFEWTSAEAWLGFNERFGVGNRNLYDLLNGHVDGMARDIAMLEVLGPNPDWMVRYLRDMAVQEAGPDRAGRIAWRIDSVWAQVSGTANTPVNETLAGFFREARAFVTAARLGSATLSSVSDFATMRQVQAWNGLPAMGWMNDYLRLLNPKNAEDRRIAVRAGLLAESWAQRAAGAMRNQADVIGTGLGSRVAEFVLRASGLNAHTQAARWAIGMETLGVLAEQAGKRLSELPPLLRQAMGRYGIGDAEWDLLRTTGVVDMGGWRVLSPEAVARGATAEAPAPRLPAPEATRWDGDGPEAAMRLDDGSTELARLPDGISGVTPGPIRLRRGWHDAATGKGEGLAHIAAQRSGQIDEPAEEFVTRVASSFNAVHRGRDGSLVLVVRDEGRTRDTLAVALARSADGGWNVITGGRFRHTWLRGKEVLWEAERRSDLGGANAAPLQRGGQSSHDTSAARARLEAATRLLEFVQTEARFAVPEPGAAERSWMVGQTRPGTIQGELVRAALQFKSFPITVMLMHIGRALNQPSSAGVAGYLASFAIGTTVMGALAMQLKAVAQGRDPRDMTDHRFWGAAFVQGGGAGILGDFLFTAVNRADQSFYMNMVGGPMGGLVDDVARIAGLNITALADSERERAIGADLSRFLRHNAPGTTLWYARLAMDRLLWDRLQSWADPQAARRFQRMERRALQEFDQEFWWAPGEGAPRRGPDAGAMMGGRP
jgi:hypothetical protein